MTTDEAATIAVRFMETTLLVASPLFAVAVVVGVLVGVLQTATQIQEPSIAFVSKVTALVVVGALVGPAMAEKLMAYTRASFEAIARVTE
jgi:flagellar biosynthetic protein FliQ